MRGLTFVLAVATINAVVPNALAEGKLRLAQTSTVSRCMMTCNAQAANCRTGCVLPSPSASGAVSTNIPNSPNPTANTTCNLNCGTTQVACQTNCGLQSPSP